jgi:hypothetical protein
VPPLSSDDSTSEYLRVAGEPELSAEQIAALAAMRRVLEQVRPAGVEPAATFASVPKRSLRMKIPQVADPQMLLEISAESWGEVVPSCSALGSDFFLKFNDPSEPWENAGDLDDAAELVRAVLEGRVEMRVSTFRGRAVRSELFVTDPDGDQEGRGRHYHLPDAVLATLGLARKRILRTTFHIAPP